MNEFGEPERRPLWAPWRVEFIRGSKSGSCFLCNNQQPDISRDEEKLIVKRGKTVYLMLNRYPYNPGHLLLAPYRHVGDIALLTEDERHELMDFCVIGKSALADLTHPQAFNVGLNLGAAAGAGVAEHLHMHIVPRWNGDNNFMPVLADVRCVPEALEATSELMRNYFAEKDC
ncbi:MAG: HIT domain-containing protein [Lentisphaeria bacterium]|nr:HIT domain-containing protein [Lentisphaeria bacterium]